MTSPQSVAHYQTAFENKAPCKLTAYNWFAEFKHCCVYLSDELRDDRPSTAVNNENINALCHNDRNGMSCDLPWDWGILKHRYELDTVNSTKI